MDQLLQRHHYFVLRFLAEDLGKQLDSVLDTILAALVHCDRLEIVLSVLATFFQSWTKFVKLGFFLSLFDVRMLDAWTIPVKVRHVFRQTGYKAIPGLFEKVRPYLPSKTLGLANFSLAKKSAGLKIRAVSF